MAEPLSPSEKTIREDVDQTFAESSSPADLPDSWATPLTLHTFREWHVLEAFPARGSEADIYLLSHAGEHRILKLYRTGIEPDQKVHAKIANLSRQYPDHFVQIHEQGFDEKLGRFYELQEYFPNGTLHSLLGRSRLPEAVIEQFLAQAAKILATMHSNGVLHLDLKPANILLRTIDPLSIVVTDFGIASLLGTTDSKRITGVKGTSLYQSPESVSGVVEIKSDWWGLGIILLEMLAGEHPFGGMQRQVIYYHLTTHGVSIPANLSPRCTVLLKGLLTRNPEKRWGETEVREWLSGKEPHQFFDSEKAGSPAGSAGTDRPHPEWWTRFLIQRTFRGVSYYSLEEMIEAFLSSKSAWEEGKAHFAHGHITRWLRSNQDFDRSDQIIRLLGEGDFLDLAFFRFIVLFRPDLPLNWCGTPIDLSFLEKILHHAGESKLDGDELLFIESLFKGVFSGIILGGGGKIPTGLDRILDLAAMLPNTPMAALPIPRRANLLSTATSDNLRQIPALEHIRRLLAEHPGEGVLFQIVGTNGFIEWIAQGHIISEDETILWLAALACQNRWHSGTGHLVLESLTGNEKELVAVVSETEGYQSELLRFLENHRISEGGFEALREALNRHPKIEPYFKLALGFEPSHDFSLFCRRFQLFLRLQSHRSLFRECLLPPLLSEALDQNQKKSSLDFVFHAPLEAFSEAIQDPGIFPARHGQHLQNWSDLMILLEDQHVRGCDIRDTATLRHVTALVKTVRQIHTNQMEDPKSWRKIQVASLLGILSGALFLLFGLPFPLCAVLSGLGGAAYLWAKWSEIAEHRQLLHRLNALRKTLNPPEKPIPSP